MRVKGPNGLIFEVDDVVATAMIDSGYLKAVTSHVAPDAPPADPPAEDAPPANPPADPPAEEDSAEEPVVEDPKPSRRGRGK